MKGAQIDPPNGKTTFKKPTYIRVNYEPLFYNSFGKTQLPSSPVTYYPCLHLRITHTRREGY